MFYFFIFGRHVFGECGFSFSPREHIWRTCIHHVLSFFSPASHGLVGAAKQAGLLSLFLPPFHAGLEQPIANWAKRGSITRWW